MGCFIKPKSSHDKVELLSDEVRLTGAYCIMN